MAKTAKSPTKVLIKCARKMITDAEEVARNSYAGPRLDWRKEWFRADPKGYEIARALGQACDEAKSSA